MIKKIDIKQFGLFKNYSWDKNVGKEETFRLQNIIYGRNYTGKTTLARIFKSIEDRKLHKNYSDCNFEVTLKDGRIITHQNLTTIDTDYKVRVYNSDFVSENLSWLHNDDGTIKSFTILGAKNVDLDKKIKAIQEKLGAEEETKGLIFELSKKKEAYEVQKGKYDKKNNDLDRQLKAKAQSIKNNAAVFNYPTYQINTIKGDITNVTKDSILTDKQIDEKKTLLKEESKGNIEIIEDSNPCFLNFSSNTIELLKRQIKANKPITDLINDSQLQEWVRQGIDKHKGKRKTCGFCSNDLASDLFEKLEAHFSKESEELRTELNEQIIAIEIEKKKFSDYLALKKDMFYETLFPNFETILKDWSKTLKAYLRNLDKLIDQIRLRELDIFKNIELKDIEDESVRITELVKEFNLLIEKHNLKTSTLSIDQKAARNDLRLSEVAKFLEDIEYERQTKEINLEFDIINKLEKEINTDSRVIILLNEEKRTLEAQSKDESKGAELVNQHLTHFFGHNELKLIADGVFPNIKFKITRDSINANNLSEGECSLISFCYFIAKMEDEMKDEQNIDKLIIYIDDPISSLDSNHIFFMFSLIENIIAKPKKYGQLFISTHNLDFLKYLKRLTNPNKHEITPNVKKISGIQHFMIERSNKKNTQLKLAPEYLKNYITEFNYLFDQIYKCSILNIEAIDHNYQYNFGNNMRKFLEAYLFYKYPNHNMSLEERLDKFFDKDSISITLINRVINEYSHLGDQFDRSIEPIDIDSINKIATAVINKIKESDQNQYEALIESITDVSDK